MNEIYECALALVLALAFKLSFGWSGATWLECVNDKKVFLLFYWYIPC